MALSLDSTYHNIYYKNVLTKIREIINDDRDYGAVYIGPVYEDRGNYSVRIWGLTAETTQNLTSGEWSRTYNTEISMYMVEPSPNENFWEQYYADGERLYQLLYNNESVAGSLGWYDGTVESMRINEMEAEEEAVDGLWTIKYNFVCRINRAN